MNDKEILDWLEEHVCYVMIRGRYAMYALPNNGRGWNKGELRHAVIKENNEYLRKNEA